MKEVLIIRLSSIGDVLHCTPVAASLKAAWPDCRITWLVGETAAELLRYNPDIDEVMVWSRERFDAFIKQRRFIEALRLLRELKTALAARRFFAVLDIHGLLLTGLIASMVKADKRIGLSGTREFNSVFMSKTAEPVGRHITERYLGVLSPLGIKPARRAMKLVVGEEARRTADILLKEQKVRPGRRLAVLVPGTTWASKNWPAYLYAQTARLLARDFEIVLCGGRAESGMGLDIQLKAGRRLVNMIGETSLQQMAAVIEKADVLVAGDTGPLYMADAVGTPTVSIFGPTNPAVYAPRGSRHVFLCNTLRCSFCHKTTCRRGEAVCIASITPQAVVQGVYKVTGLPRRYSSWGKPVLKNEPE